MKPTGGSELLRVEALRCCTLEVPSSERCVPGATETSLRARPEAASADAGRTAGTHSANAVCAFERSGSSEAVHRSPQCTGIGLEPCSSPKKEKIIITISIIITILTSSSTSTITRTWTGTSTIIGLV